MSERLLGIYEKLILRRPVASIVAVLLLATGMAFGLPNFKLDASADSLTLENDNSLTYFRESLLRYGSSDFLVVTYTPYEGDLFDDNSLNALNEMHEELAKIDGVASVTSMLNVPLLYSPKFLSHNSRKRHAHCCCQTLTGSWLARSSSKARSTAT